MSAITLSNEMVHYEVLGRGRPVVLIHGWIGSWRYWIPTMQQLQLKYRVYALDLFGFGDSGKNPAKYSLDQQVQLLSTFLRELGVSKAALFGHGLGAMVTAEFARLFPDMVPRLMIASAPLFDTGDLDVRVPAGTQMPLTANRSAQPATVDEEKATSDATIMSASTAMRAALAEAARARSTNPILDGRDGIPNPAADFASRPEWSSNARNLLQSSIGDVGLEQLLSRCFKRSEPEFNKLKVDVDKTDDAVLKRSISGYDAGRMLDTLRALPMPTVVIHGMEDPIIPPPNENVLTYITSSKEESLMPILLPNVRHFPMLEHERFFRLATDFLEVPEISKLEIKERWIRRTR